MIAMYEDGFAAMDPHVDSLLRRVVDTANRLVRDILPGAPRLDYRVGDPHEWLQGDLPAWTADVGNDHMLPLSQLSHAEARWASLACALAVTLEQRRDTEMLVFVCDEPETGLHLWQAENQLPRSLTRWAAEAQASIVVATHSPAMLNLQEVEAVHVTRLPSRHVVTHPLAVDLREGLSRELATLDLGLTPADLLQMVRVFLIVEGPHDQAVLRQLLGPPPSTHPVVIIPVGGAKHLASLATAHVLWDFTEADFVVVLDGMIAEQVQPIWAEAQALRDRGDRRSRLNVHYDR